MGNFTWPEPAHGIIDGWEYYGGLPNSDRDAFRWLKVGDIVQDIAGTNAPLVVASIYGDVVSAKDHLGKNTSIINIVNWRVKR